jgi:predicted CxxxxCH...CXXCH cytochrome family protein
MKITRLFMLLLAMVVAACDSGTGPHSLLGRSSPHTAGTVSPCTRCHSSSNTPDLDPLVTGGTGTAGKHVKHVTERGIDCEVCHKDYFTNPDHMNGTIDTGSSVATAVSFSVTGPAGAWVNAAGPRAGTCSGVACHGTAAMEWYGTAGWTLPACTECHASAFSSALDPASTNGAPPAGRHGKHVSSRGIGCERCHFQYPSRLTHMNGRMDTADAAAALVNFSITGPSGSWMNNSGPGSGQCAGVSCHGTDTLDWYGTGTWALPSSCTTCHASSYSNVLDPALTNGSGLSGKHVRHTASLGLTCTKCHLGYPARTSHMSGIMDTQDPAVLLVAFDAANAQGSWVSDSGPQSGGCSNLACHATQTPDWYGLAGVSLPPCATCHAGPAGPRRAVMGAGGDFGANAAILSHHVTNGPGNDPVADQCLVCHEMDRHMGGTVRLHDADTGAAISFDPAAPASLEPFCLSCHDADGAAAAFRSGGTPTTPFLDGSVMGQAPNRASVEIFANWDKTFGHRRQGLTCMGNGNPNTGCHANGHGSTFVGILARNLALPSAKTNWFTVADEPDYDLCFTCHAANARVSKEAILGMKANGNYALGLASEGAVPAYTTANIQTLFRDVNLGTTGKAYDDSAFFSSDHENLHMYHLQIGPAWNYRDSTSSSVVCLTCHSVHGSNTPFGWVHDEMLFSHFAGAGADAYGMLGAPLNLPNYPVSCTFNCHDPGIVGVLHSWFEPSDE